MALALLALVGVEFGLAAFFAPGGRPRRLAPVVEVIFDPVGGASEFGRRIVAGLSCNTFRVNEVVAAATMLAAVLVIMLGSSWITLRLLAALSTGSAQFTYCRVTSLNSPRTSSSVGTFCLENSHSWRFLPSVGVGVITFGSFGSGAYPSPIFSPEISSRGRLSEEGILGCRYPELSCF
ncbi:hypothetical protein F2Q69_00039553 [Brassica cretica]|uniref:CASP-like protein n=1 Tax=Brassica cretica TaxID=69181 RepID=A0A8S9NK49_BRACR|nr:hypothetical protein F2Q69_00039553 [Brassica cretica]